MAKLKINHYVVGPVQTNCYFAINDETKELIIIDPGYSPKAIVRLNTLVTILIFSGSAPTKFVFKNKGFGTFFQCLPDLPLCLVAFIHIFPFFSTKKDQVNFSTQSVNNNNI